MEADSRFFQPGLAELYRRAEQVLADMHQHQASLAVLFIGLDRLKQINNNIGREAGDSLLQLIAERLHQQLRHSDIVGHLSGDEFLVILPQCSTEHVAEVAEQLQGAIRQPCQVAGSNLLPSASIGISLFPQDGQQLTDLIQRADFAMQQAKQAGRDRFSFFCHQLNQQHQYRWVMETALRQALQQQALQLHYQPQLNMQDGSLYGVEALARWHHAELGQIAPDSFIPLAEQCGLITELDLWAIRQACCQLASWRQQGLHIPVVAVNLSSTDFQDPDLPDKVAAILQQYQLSGSDLTLELTEGVLLDQHPVTINSLQQLHSQGIQLAMDDFGTGYSSLNYLRHLPIRQLKLDRSFVQDLAVDAVSRTLCEAVLRIGESLQLTVVAEGIELDSQYQVLQQQGYPVAQGYLLSPPLSAVGFEQWLRARYSW